MKLTIPSDMGYGASGSPPKIPADSTLVFDIEVFGVEKKSVRDEF